MSSQWTQSRPDPPVDAVWICFNWEFWPSFSSALKSISLIYLISTLPSISTTLLLCVLFVVDTHSFCVLFGVCVVCSVCCCMYVHVCLFFQSSEEMMIYIVESPTD